MEIRNIKRHGTSKYTYSGEVGGNKVIVIFENSLPVEGDIKVISGKMVTKNNQNFYYINKYEVI